MRLDVEGNLLWERKFRGSFTVLPALTALPGGGFAFLLVSARRAAVLHFDAAGILSWEKTIVDAHRIAPLPGGGLAVAGWDRDPPDLHDNAWVLALDAHGAQLWKDTFSGYPLLAGQPDGTLTVMDTPVPEDERAIWGDITRLTRLDRQGRYLWQRKLQTRGWGARSFAALPDGGLALVLAGITFITRSDGLHITRTSEVRRLGSSGRELWGENFGSRQDDEFPASIAALADGGLVITGTRETESTGDHDIFVIRLESEAAADIARRKRYQRLTDGLIQVDDVTQIVGEGVKLRDLPEAQAVVVEEMPVGRQVHVIGVLPTGWLMVAEEGVPVGWIYKTAVAQAGISLLSPSFDAVSESVFTDAAVDLWRGFRSDRRYKIAVSNIKPDWMNLDDDLFRRANNALERALTRTGENRRHLILARTTLLSVINALEGEGLGKDVDALRRGLLEAAIADVLIVATYNQSGGDIAMSLQAVRVEDGALLSSSREFLVLLSSTANR